MTNLHRLLMLVVLLLVSISLTAQQITITGTVVDENSNPLSGVTVQIKGTKSGTVTDINGKFSLLAPVEGVVKFSFIGFISLEEPVSRMPNLLILKEDLIAMDEVVVTALGMKRRKRHSHIPLPN